MGRESAGTAPEDLRYCPGCDHRLIRTWNASWCDACGWGTLVTRGATNEGAKT